MNSTTPLFDLPLMSADRDRVEAALRASVQTSDAYLTEIASHLIVAGGKRLRPVLALAAAQIGTDSLVSVEVVQGAIACELVHLGSLYHDDVMDESTMRRGVETVNAKWGNLQAIVAGDFLLARASEIAASLGNEVSSLLARTIGRLCEGQVEELRHTYDRGRTVPSYLVSIQGKTASLFATSARIGSLVAGHSRTTTDTITNIADAYGMVFQIVDDVLDVVASDEQLGKPAGHDMEEGVYTLPVLLTLAADTAESRELYDMLGSPLTAKERTKALKIVRNGGGLAAALDSAHNYVALAEAECAKLPAGAATDALRRAPRALLESLVNV
ncbi:MAG: polyprenyl synthetase family protein [Ilumatobacteraceae bacterium]|jgi:heptaprenyl diphosphate synthase|nr:polyprenyl synthetase family protein [Ilumatobacteraceae bacterium]